MKKKIRLLSFACLVLSGMVGCGSNQPSAPTFTDDQYQYLLGEFYGVDKTLTVTNKSLVIEGKTSETYLPTEIKEESITYKVGSHTTRETVIAVYYGKKRNKANYRLTVSSDEFKLIEFQKEENNKYVTQYYFSPKADYFAGAYNLTGEYSSKNLVWIFSDTFVTSTISDKYAGYEGSVYYEYGRALASAQGLLVPGYCFAKVENEMAVLTVAKLLDASDGGFFEGLLYTNENSVNLHMIYDGNITPDYFYADQHMFTQQICNEEGKTLLNYYSSYDPYTYEDGDFYLVDNEKATYSVARGDKGLIYSFTVSDSKVYNVTINANGYRYTVGNEAHYFAPLTSWFEIPDPYSDELVLVSDNLSNQLSMQYQDIDWDLWVCIDPLFKWNGSKIEDYKFTATERGNIIFSFTADNVAHSFMRGSSYVAIDVVGETISYYYNFAYVKELYVGNFYSGGETNVKIDSDLKVSINGADKVQCSIDLDADYGIILYLDANKKLIFVNFGLEDVRVCGLFNKETNKSTFLLDEKDFNSVVDEYTSKGTDSFNLDGKYKLSVDGESVNYSVVLLQTDSSNLVALTYEISSVAYYAVLSFNGIVNLYRADSSAGFVYVKTMFSKKAFDSLLGKYQYDGKYGTETLLFREDGKLFLDNYIDGQIVPEEHDFTISINNGVYTLNVLGESAQGTYSLPFVLAENYTLVFNDLFYTREELHALKGTYGHKASKTTMLVVNGTFYINNQKQVVSNISSDYIGGKLNSATFTTEKYTIQLSYNASGDKVVQLYETADEAGTKITFDDSDDRFLDFSKTYTQTLEDGTTATWGLSTQYNSYNNKVETRLMYNGAASGGSWFYLEYADDGTLCVRGSAVMQNYHFYFDASGNGVAVKL